MFSLTFFPTGWFRSLRSAAACFLLTCPFVSAQESAGDDGGRSMRAFPVDTPITIDGRLAENAWKDAVPAGDFIQRELREGEPSTERTEVRILYDVDNLYIGIMCYDREPDRIVHTDMERDSELDSDDSFTVVIDTFRDKRNGYYFSTNPNSVLKDALMYNGGHDESWNGIWDVSARITDQGWSAEMIIPFKTLRFSSTPGQDWSINFERVIQRKREETLWTAWRRNDGIFQLSKCGALTGLTDIRRSRQIDFKPYTLGGLEKVSGTELDRNFKYGLDVKYPVTSQLTLDLTTFTDFAQVESDREQINLTQFDINYEEKREFFLEGASIFEFGSPVTTPFYSRRIGIAESDSERVSVPILGGAKLVGKAGSYNIGVIDMQTDREGDAPSTNYSVVRVKKDVLEKSYIGFIATNATLGGDHSSQAYGVDFLYRTDRFLKRQNMEFGGYVAENRKPGVHSANHAGRVLMNLPNDLYNVALLFHNVGSNYSPETGFVRRNDIKQYHGEIDITPRPGIPGIKKLLFMPINYNYITDSGTKLMTRTAEIRPFGVEFNSGDSIELNMYGNYEYVEDGFERFRGKMKVPEGAYKWWEYEMEFNSSTSRPYSLGVHTHTGDLYNGSMKSVYSELGVRKSKYYSISGDFSYERITMNGVKFDVQDYGTRIGINFTSRLTTSSLIQYNNETRKVNLNFRLHYIPSIGSDVYLVYNHLWDEEDHYRTLQNTGIFKVAYMLRY